MKYSRTSLLFFVLLCVAAICCMGCFEAITGDQPKPVRLTISFFVADSLTTSPVSGASVQLTIHSYGQQDRIVPLTTNASGLTASVSFESLSQTDQQALDVIVKKDGYLDHNETIVYKNNDKLTPYPVQMQIS